VAAFRKPDVLVLGGGGILGEAWMSAVLAGLEDSVGFDARRCDGYVGTSAGSIVAATLAAGVDPRRRLGDLPEPPPVTGGDDLDESRHPAQQAVDFGLATAERMLAPLAALGLRFTEPAGALVRRAALQRVPPGRRSLERLGSELEGARWDGRLRVATVELESGRRVVFGDDGAPSAPVATAVQASCAIPGVFEPVVIAGRRYVDGGVWSPTNMDRAQAGRGTRVLCLNPTGAMRSALGSLLGGLGSVSRRLAAIEAVTLRRRGADVAIVSPDGASQEAMGLNLMDPTPRSRVIAAGLAQGRAARADERG
jgi:NTE family protein